MLVSGATAIWVAVIGALVYAVWRRRRAHSEQAARNLILWGGAVGPSVVLALLLGFTFWLMPSIRPWSEPAEASGNLRIEVVGEQYWWRVRYHPPGGPPVDSANEIRLPVGEQVDFELASPDVIHSFWVPGLAGKMDLVPGRLTRLSVEANEAGRYRGTCAEFCGASHALMSFAVVAMPPEDFETWLAARSVPSPAAGSSGHPAFMANGCAACHTIRGTAASGVLGPDLSHVGSRETLAAGVLPVTVEAFASFISDPDDIKPGAHMPAFDMLPPEEILAIATYLESLR